MNGFPGAQNHICSAGDVRSSKSRPYDLGLGPTGPADLPLPASKGNRVADLMRGPAGDLPCRALKAICAFQTKQRRNVSSQHVRTAPMSHGKLKVDHPPRPVLFPSHLPGPGRALQ